MKVLTFGKNRGKALEKCEESYIKWLASHEKVLSVGNRWASKFAKQLLEKKEEKIEIHKEYEDGYRIVKMDGKFLCQKDGELMIDENGDPSSFNDVYMAEYIIECIVGSDEDDLFGSFEDEVDKRRQGEKSEYLDQLDAEREERERANAKREAVFLLDEEQEVGDIVWSGSLQYRVAEKPNYLSPSEAGSLEDLAPNMGAGWYTKVELVA